MGSMIGKLLQYWFTILLIIPVGLTAQDVTGSWYGRANILLEGYSNTYLAELTLRQKGNQVEGIFGYYFKTQYRSFLVKGSYNPKTRLLTIKNLPVTYFNSNLEDAPADCYMTLEASLTVARSKSSLKGFILRDSIYRHTCPDLNVQLTRDPESNVDSILAVAKAQEFDWKQSANQTQEAKARVDNSNREKVITPVQVRELSEATKEQLRKELEVEVRAELRKELEAEVREQLKKEMAWQFLQDLKKEIEQQLSTTLKAEIEEKVRSEVRKEFEAQIRQELKKEIEQQVRSELRKELEQQMAEARQSAALPAERPVPQTTVPEKTAATKNSAATVSAGNKGSSSPTPSSEGTPVADNRTVKNNVERDKVLPGIRIFSRDRDRKKRMNSTTGSENQSSVDTGRTRMITGMATSENTRSREVTSNETKLKVVKAFEERMLYVSQEIEISSDSIRVIFYDNGYVDDDTITVFYNKVPVLEKQRLTDKGLELGIRLDSKSDLHDLSMFAENVGSIPPNTALMVIYDGEERHEIFLSSTMRVNGTVRMKKKKR